MKDESRVIMGAALGAVAGGTLAFVMTTARGREALRQLDATLDDLSRFLEELVVVVGKVDAVVQETKAAVASASSATGP